MKSETLEGFAPLLFCSIEEMVAMIHLDTLKIILQKLLFFCCHNLLISLIYMSVLICNYADLGVHFLKRECDTPGSVEIDKQH